MAGTCNLAIPQRNCTLDTCCIEQQGVISYQPTLPGNAAYAGIFAVILAVQTIIFIMNPKTWGFYVGMLFGLILEIVGYVGRVMIHNNPFSLDNFIIYLVCLTIGPAFIMAAIYMVMGRVVVAYGEHHSLLRPFYYSLVVIICDLISLVLQALGGALAATGAKSNDASAGHDQAQMGTNIMVAGLSFQLFSTVVFSVLCAYFFNNVIRNKTDRNPSFVSITSNWRFKALLAAMLVATVTIFIRSAFRVNELKDGFNSSAANNETLFMVFEGPMLIVATLALTIFHPAYMFQGKYGNANWGRKGQSSKVESTEGSQFESIREVTQA